MEPTDFQHVARQFPVPARLSLFPEVDNSSTSNNKCSSEQVRPAMVCVERKDS